jgi:hypothetical protein
MDNIDIAREQFDNAVKVMIDTLTMNKVYANILMWIFLIIPSTTIAYLCIKKDDFNFFILSPSMIVGYLLIILSTVPIYYSITQIIGLKKYSSIRTLKSDRNGAKKVISFLVEHYFDTIIKFMNDNIPQKFQYEFINISFSLNNSTTLLTEKYSYNRLFSALRYTIQQN